MVDHPKMITISGEAKWSFVEMLLYCQAQLTNGFIDERVAHRKWSDTAINELTTNDATNPTLYKVEGGYQIHDYCEYQRSSEEVVRIKEAKRAAGAKGGVASGEARRSKIEAESKQNLSKTKPDTETDTETDIKRATRINENWNLDDSLLAWTRETAPNLNIVFEREKFVDYWLSKSGRDATKTDWGRTWKNWVRSNVERNPSLASKPVQSDPNEWMIAQRIELT